MPNPPHERPSFYEETTTGQVFRRRSYVPEEGGPVVSEYDSLSPLRDDTTFDPTDLDTPAPAEPAAMPGTLAARPEPPPPGSWVSRVAVGTLIVALLAGVLALGGAITTVVLVLT